MDFPISKIAEIIHGEIAGDRNARIHTLCKIEEGIPGGLSFLSNPKYTRYIYDTGATAVIVDRGFVPEKPVKTTLIKVENSYLAFAALLDFYQKMKPAKRGISPHASIAPSAKIGKDVYIGDFVSIGDDTVVGDGVKLYPHVWLGDRVSVGGGTVLNSGVKVYDECRIGRECVIHAGSVIGADGFGFAPQEEGYMKIPQIGNVVIEDRVEVGANCCIDRATIGSTIIRHDVKLDNLIQIAHNVEVGAGSAFAAQVGVAGSTKVGKGCIFAGQVGVAGHLVVGDHVTLGGQSGISSSVPSGQVLLGSPAIPFQEERKLIVYRKKLPLLYQQVDRIEKIMKEEKGNS